MNWSNAHRIADEHDQEVTHIETEAYVSMADVIHAGGASYDRARGQQDRDYPAYGECPEGWRRSHLGETLLQLAALSTNPDPEKAERLEALFASFEEKWKREREEKNGPHE